MKKLPVYAIRLISNYKSLRNYCGTVGVKHGMPITQQLPKSQPTSHVSVRFNSTDDPIDGEIVEHETTLSMFSQDERKVLFRDTDDHCLRKLVEAKTVAQLVSVVRDQNSSLSEKHSCQVIAALSDLKKDSSFSRKVIKDINDFTMSPEFENLCTLIAHNVHTLSDSVLVATLYCAKKAGLSWNTNTLFAVLFNTCWQRFSTARFSLMELAVLSASVAKSGLKGLMLQKRIVELLHSRVEHCTSQDDLQCFASVTSSAFPVVTSQFVDKVLLQYEDMLLRNVPINPSTALSCLQALVSNKHDLSHTTVVQQLHQQFKVFVPSLSMKQLIVLFLTLRYIESDKYNLLVDISARAIKLLEKSGNPLDHLTLLNCIDPVTLKGIERQVLDILASAHSEWTIAYHGTKFTRVLRNLRCLDKAIVDPFWSECLCRMDGEGDEQILCQMYLRFKFLFFRYSHSNLEDRLKEVLMNQLKISGGFYPAEVALAASFFIIAGKQPLPDFLFERILSVGPQWSVHDVEKVSKCLKTADGLRLNRKLRQQQSDIRNMLDNRTTTALRQVSSLSDMRRLGDACLDRHRSLDNGLFYDVMDRYHIFLPTLSSRSVLAISHQIGEASYFCPTLLDGLANYVTKNVEVTGWTAANLLYACYKVSYLPQEDEEFLTACISAMRRDFSLLTCLKVLQGAVALALFRNLPEFIVHGIFNTEFLEKLDKEMEATFFATRNNTFRHCLFEVNRIVCLEYPELNVPWFHENYGEALVFQVPFRESKFGSEVLEILTLVLGGQAYSRANVFTPYYYRLNFEAILDASKTPLVASDYGSTAWGANPFSDKERAKISADLPPGAQRVAITVLPEKAYCSNARHLKGVLHLKRRHLEIMNYKVVEVPYFEWYSMQLADRQARVKYMEKKLFSY